MVALLAIVSSLVAASAVHAVRIPNVHRSLSHRTVTPPEGWITEIMEPYAEYNARYTALNCKAQHNTSFFDACCHPMKKDETLETARAAYCNPANEPVTSVASATATSAASAATNVSTGGNGDDDDDDDEDCEDDDDDDDDDEDCDDDDGEPATSAIPTSVATSTPTPSPSKMKTSKISKPTPSPAPQTSTAAAPETTTSAAPKPTTTSKATPKPTTSKAPEPTTTAAASSGGSGGQTVTGGKGTFFYQGGAAGSCGVYNSDDTPLVAVDAAMMKPSLCGKFVEVTNLANGKQVKAKIQDTCPGCPNAASLDLSVGAFNAIAEEATGVIDIKYTILD